MPSVYNPFDQTKPDVATQTRKAAIDSARFNDASVRDFVMLAASMLWTYSKTVGTGTAERPQYILFRNTVNTNLWIRGTFTWGTSGGADGNPTQIVWQYSDDNQATWAAIGTIVFSYDGSGNLDTTTGGGGFITYLMYLLGKHKVLKAAYDGHAVSLIAHSMLGMAQQSPAAVAVTGGTANNLVIGETTPALASFVRLREKSFDLGNISGNPITINMNNGSHFRATATGNCTFSYSNLPPSGSYATVLFDLTNGGAFVISWGVGTQAPGGVAPVLTASGKDRIAITCNHAGQIDVVLVEKDIKNIA